MKTVILHIGLHKTGTTTLQGCLKGYKSQEIKYASFEHKNHSIPIFTIFSDNRYKYHIWKTAGLNNKEIDQYRLKNIRVLENDLLDRSSSKLLISGEDISILKKREKEALIEFFKKRNADVEVIAYVRSPISWCASTFSSLVRQGNNIKRLNINYKSRISPFINILGKDKVRVFDFDLITTKPNGLLNHFSNLFGLPKMISPKLNTSLSLLALALTWELNKLCKNIEIPLILQKRLELVNLIKNFFDEKNGFNPADPQVLFQICNSSVKDECDWLNNSFGIQFPSPLKSNSVPLEEYLNEAIKNNTLSVGKFFEKFGFKIDPSSSIKFMLLNLLISLLEIPGQKVFDLDDRDFIYKSFLEHNFKNESPVQLNPISYLIINPDVLKARIAPAYHYLVYGKNEMRKY